MLFRQGTERRNGQWIYFATALANAAQQRFSRGAKGTVLPAGVLPSRIALLPLQSPLQLIIQKSPIVIK
jgi:hypothetical protein